MKRQICFQNEVVSTAEVRSMWSCHCCSNL